MTLKSVFPAIALIFMILSISAQSSIAETSIKYVTVSYKFDSPITLHEPVYLNVQFQNQMPYGITFDLGLLSKGAFDLQIDMPNGQQRNYSTKNMAYDGPEVYSRVYLAPKETTMKRFLMNDWYEQDEPYFISTYNLVGNYHIKIKLDLPIIKGKTEQRIVTIEREYYHQTEESELDFAILPRNEAVLKQRCDELFSKWQFAPYRDKPPLFQELSYITDPIAIPYLAKLADKEDYYAFFGLRRIGTDKAMEAMIPITRSTHDSNIAAEAKKYLIQNMHKIQDPDIREKIEAAVQSRY